MSGRCTDRRCRGGESCPAGGGINCAAWSGSTGDGVPSMAGRCTDRRCPGGDGCPAGGGINCAAWSGSVAGGYHDALPPQSYKPADRAVGKGVGKSGSGRCTDRRCRGGESCPAGGGINCAAWSGSTGGGVPSMVGRCTDRRCPGGDGCPAGGGINCAAWSGSVAGGYHDAPPPQSYKPADRGPQSYKPADRGVGKGVGSSGSGRCTDRSHDSLPPYKPIEHGARKASRVGHREWSESVEDGYLDGPQYETSRVPFGGYSGKSTKMQTESRNIAAMPDFVGVAEKGGPHERPPPIPMHSSAGPSGDDEKDTSEEPVYLSEASKKWECHYLKRIAKRIYRLILKALNNVEETFFLQFLFSDKDAKGMLSFDQAEEMFETIENVAPGTADPPRIDDLLEQDGSLSFVALLKWLSRNETDRVDTIGARLASTVGNGLAEGDSRIDELSHKSLQSNVIGYRRLLRHVLKFHEDQALEHARNIERTDGLGDAMKAYYAAIVKQFEGDEEYLFELFHEVDVSGFMLLEESGVRRLLLLFDTSATEADIKRYIMEINVDEGPVSFANFADWWDQAYANPKSLRSEKGTTLTARIKAAVAQRRFGGMFTESSVHARWRKAGHSSQLRTLRDAYIRTLAEMCEYKVQRDLLLAEEESAEI